MHFINLQISCFVKTDWLLWMTTQNKYMYKLYVFARWVHFLPSLTVAWLLLCCIFAKTGKKWDEECYYKNHGLKSLFKTLTAKVEEQRNTQRQDFNLLNHRTLLRFHDHQITISQALQHYFKELLFPTPKITGECFSKIKICNKISYSVWKKQLISSAWSSP